MGKLKEKDVDKPLLTCTLCDKRHSVQDVRDGKFAAETGICMKCYGKMRRSSSTCFGKKQHGRTLGYDPEAPECQAFCWDRKICKSLVET